MVSFLKVGHKGWEPSWQLCHCLPTWGVLALAQSSLQPPVPRSSEQRRKSPLPSRLQPLARAHWWPWVELCHKEGQLLHYHAEPVSFLIVYSRKEVWPHLCISKRCITMYFPKQESPWPLSAQRRAACGFEHFPPRFKDSRINFSRQGSRSLFWLPLLL